jgi:hypothetical protein
MKFDLFDKDGRVIHESKSLRGIRRHVHPNNIDHVGVIKAFPGLLIVFKNNSYLQVDFPTKETRDATLGRWRNLKKVKRVDE